MKKFNLEEYLQNPDRKVVTRAGSKVRIVCTDKKGRYPVDALVEHYDSSERVYGFTADGSYYIGSTDEKDLFFAPDKREGWVNIYRDLDSGELCCGSIFDSKEGAQKRGGIATAKIEWEE